MLGELHQSWFRSARLWQNSVKNRIRNTNFCVVLSKHVHVFIIQSPSLPLMEASRYFNEELRAKHFVQTPQKDYAINFASSKNNEIKISKTASKFNGIIFMSLRCGTKIKNRRLGGKKQKKYSMSENRLLFQISFKLNKSSSVPHFVSFLREKVLHAVDFQVPLRAPVLVSLDSPEQ